MVDGRAGEGSEGEQARKMIEGFREGHNHPTALDTCIARRRRQPGGRWTEYGGVMEEGHGATYRKRSSKLPQAPEHG